MALKTGPKSVRGCLPNMEYSPEVVSSADKGQLILIQMA